MSADNCKVQALHIYCIHGNTTPLYTVSMATPHLCLLLLCESLAGGLAAVADKAHHPDEGCMLRQHVCYLLHTLTILGENHHSCVHRSPGSASRRSRLLAKFSKVSHNHLLKFDQLWMTVKEESAAPLTPRAASRSPPTWAVRDTSLAKFLLQVSHDSSNLGASHNLHLGSRLSPSCAEGLGQELVEGAHAVLQQEFVGVVETDGKSKVSFNHTHLKREDKNFPSYYQLPCHKGACVKTLPPPLLHALWLPPEEGSFGTGPSPVRSGTC